MTELPSSTNSQIGKVELARGAEHVTYLRTIVNEGELHSKTQRDDRVDGDITLELSDAKRVIETDHPEELPHIEPVEDPHPMYSCNMCGVAEEAVHRYVSIQGSFPISFHYECLREFAKESIRLIESNSDELVASHI